ncbi:MAG TPA: class I SAM-dependent methyltransferase [Polyangia bacterium]|nr:class I SAM-dependent methyltransferase [Polyangia bacterium]
MCGACGGGALEPVVSLGAMPHVNTFLTADRVAEEERSPLDVYFCPSCTLVQLSPVVDPRRLFTEYAYLTSTARTTVAYLADLATALVRGFGLSASSRVLEIGSNDGTLLGQLRGVTPHVLGIDPARNVAARAEAAGVRTIVDFFSSRTAIAIEGEHGPFDLVLALNVVAHTPDFVDLLAGARRLLAPGGRFVMECAYVLPTILAGEIDTIYHEHVYCFSLRALASAAARVGLTVVDAREIAVQGGSLRVVMQPLSFHNEIDAGVAALLRKEHDAGLHLGATYAPVAARARTLRDDLRAGLDRLRCTADVVVGLGAPARGVVLMNHCGLTRADLDFVVDDTPLKQGKVVPGCHIPVFDWTRIEKDGNIAALMLSWNYRREVLDKLRRRTTNARVLVPLPTMEEVRVA